MLAHNDFPQGEFWSVYENKSHPDVGHANKNGRFFSRAAVLSARRVKDRALDLALHRGIDIADVDMLLG